MKNYVRYKLLLEEPVKMGKQGDQSNTETLTYIVGSSLRGAFLSLYINKYYHGVSNLDHDSSARRELFTETRFSDAWITLEGKYLFPFPAVYYADKHKLRAAEQKEESGSNAKLELHCCISDIPLEGEVRLGRNAYCSIADNAILQGSVKREGNLHIAVGRNGSDKKMFRYEAISSGQTFSGLIQCADETTADRYRELIDGKTIYLGGSKGSGYGRCRVVSAELIETAEAFSMYGLARKQQPGILTVLALSNLILLNENGEETGTIDEALLEKKLGITNVKLVKSYVGTAVTSGYNHTWKSWQIQRTAVSAGSLYVYTYDGTLTEESAAEFERAGVGERRVEGFGRVTLNPDIERGFLDKISEKPKYNNHLGELTADEVNVLKGIQKHVNNRRMKDIIEYEAFNTAEESKNGLTCLSKTQKARLYNLLSDVLDKRLYPNENAAKERLRNFINEDIKTGTGSVYRDRATMKIAGENHHLAEVVLLLADDKKKFRDFCKAANEFRELCFEGVTLESESDFRQKCAFIKEVIYILMRKEGSRS